MARDAGDDGAGFDPLADENASGGSDLAVPLPPSPGRARLDTLVKVRRELARVYLDARDGRRTVSDGARLAYILVQLGKMIEGADLEARVETLEREREDRP